MDKLEDYINARNQFGFYMYGEKNLDQHQKITILKSSKSNLKDLSDQLKPKIKPRSSLKKVCLSSIWFKDHLISNFIFSIQI